MTENISSLDDLKKDYQIYKQTKMVDIPKKIISPKQKDYLLKLHQQSDLAELDFFVAISKLLENSITDWSDLSSKQISYLINNQLPKHIQTKSKISLYEYRLQRIRTKVIFKARDIPLITHPNYEYGYQIKNNSNDNMNRTPADDTGNEDATTASQELCSRHFLKSWQATLPHPRGVEGWTTASQATLPHPRGVEGWTTYKLYYLRFYELAMLDFDNQTWETIEKKLILAPKLLSPQIRFRVYQTYQGYRIFLVSQPLHYRAKLTFDFLKMMAIDPWYLSFYQHHGFKVRVSPKPDRCEPYIAKYVGDWIIEYTNSEFKLSGIDRTQTKGLDPYLDELLKIHDIYCQKFLGQNST